MSVRQEPVQAPEVPDVPVTGPRRRRVATPHRRLGSRGTGTIVLAVAVLVLLGVPIGALVVSSLVTEPAIAGLGHDGPLANYVYLLGQPVYQDMLWRTLRVCLVSTTVCTLAGYLVAYALRGVSRRAERVWTVVLLASMLTGPLVAVIGWMGLFAAGEVGYRVVNLALLVVGQEPGRVIQTEAAMIIGTVHFVLPFTILAIAPAMARVPRSLEQVAFTLGAGRWRAFRTVAWPVTRPATIAAVLSSFTLSAGSYVAAQFLGGDRNLVAATAVRQMISTMTHHLASALGVLVVLACVLALGLYVRLTGTAQQAMPGREVAIGPSAMLSRWVAATVLVAAGLFLNAPLLLTAIQSVNDTSAFPAPVSGLTLRWYQEFLAYEPFRAGIVNSVTVAAGACAAALLLTVAAALAATRGPRWSRSAAALAVVSLPTMVPHIVIGLALLQFVTLLGIGLGWPVLLAAHTLVIAPYMLRTLQPVVELVDPRFEDAAATLGSRTGRTFGRIVLPQLRSGLVSAALVGFTLSFINLPVSLFLGTASTRTLPLVVSEYMSSQLDPLVACYAVFQTVVAVLVLVVGQRYLSLRLLS